MACLGAPPELPSIRPQTLSGTCGQMWLSHPSSVGSGSRSRHAQPAHWLAEGARTGCRWSAQMPPKVGCGVSIRLGVYIWGQAAPSILISLLPRSCLSVLRPGFVRFRFRRFVQEVPRCNSIYQTRYNHHHVYKSLRWVSFVELTRPALILAAVALSPARLIPVLRFSANSNLSWNTTDDTLRSVSLRFYPRAATARPCCRAAVSLHRV